MKGEVLGELRDMLLYLVLDNILGRWPPLSATPGLDLTSKQIDQLRTVHGYLLRDMIDTGLTTHAAMQAAAEDKEKKKKEIADTKKFFKEA